MFLIPDGERTYGIKPMNCPGHMLLFGNRPPQLPRAAAAPRRGGHAAPQRARRDAARPDPRAARHPGRRAHLLHPRADRGRDLRLSRLHLRYLYDLFGLDSAFELSTRPDNKLGTDEEWDFTEGALRTALERRGLEYELNEGDGAFYGPKIDLHMTDSLGRLLADGHRPARLADAAAVRAHLRRAPTTASTRPYVIHRASFGSLERFIGILIEHYGGAFPFWLAPVQIRVIPVGRGPPAGARASWPGGSSPTGSRSTSPTTPSASGSGTPRSTRSRT